MSAVLGTSAVLVLLGGPAWADEVPPGPDCTFFTMPPGDATDEPVPDPTDEPTAEPTDVVTAEPGESVTPEPGEGESGEGAVEATDEPTPDVTDEPTPDVTEEPTPDPTDDPTGEPGPEPTGYWGCIVPGMAAEGDPPAFSGGGGGAGAPQLPFSGAPVGRYLATGLGLLAAGTGTVLLARRRVS